MSEQEEFPRDENGNPTHHRCCDCGYVWQHGKHGGHDCKGNLKSQLAAVKAEREEEKRDHQLTVDTYRNVIEPKHDATKAALNASQAELSRIRGYLPKEHILVCNSNHSDPIGVDMCICVRHWMEKLAAYDQWKRDIEDSGDKDGWAALHAAQAERERLVAMVGQFNLPELEMIGDTIASKQTCHGFAVVCDGNREFGECVVQVLNALAAIQQAQQAGTATLSQGAENV